jgi:hypothetical protein
MHNIYYHDIKTTFTTICPSLEYPEKKSTITKQLQVLSPPGLTVIARIGVKEEQPFKETVTKIQNKSGKRFCSNKSLHITLLGLLNDERKSSQFYTSKIVSSTRDFIKRKHFGHMKINFNLIRLGAFFSHGEPCNNSSDGTLIAMADSGSEEVNKFNILGDDLACHLRKSFPTIFYPNIDLRLKREHPTVWCTLGYFYETDFEIDRKLVVVLEDLKSFNAAVTVSQLEVRSYQIRSLENSHLVTKISL